MNADGWLEGAGIRIFLSGIKEFGEYHCGNLNGICKVEFSHGDSYWGHWKDNIKEGYGTNYLASDSSTYTGQYKNGNKHGYGYTEW